MVEKIYVTYNEVRMFPQGVSFCSGGSRGRAVPSCATQWARVGGVIDNAHVHDLLIRPRITTGPQAVPEGGRADPRRVRAEPHDRYWRWWICSRAYPAVSPFLDACSHWRRRVRGTRGARSLRICPSICPSSSLHTTKPHLCTVGYRHTCGAYAYQKRWSIG